MSESRRFIGDRTRTVASILVAAGFMGGAVKINTHEQPAEACKLAVPANVEPASIAVEPEQTHAKASQEEINDIYAPTVERIAECAIQRAKTDGAGITNNGDGRVEVGLSTMDHANWLELKVQMYMDKEGNPDPSTAYSLALQRHDGEGDIVDRQVVIYDNNIGTGKEVAWRSTYMLGAIGSSDEADTSTNKQVSKDAETIVGRIMVSPSYLPPGPIAPGTLA